MGAKGSLWRGGIKILIPLVLKFTVSLTRKCGSDKHQLSREDPENCEKKFMPRIKASEKKKCWL